MQRRSATAHFSGYRTGGSASAAAASQAGNGSGSSQLTASAMTRSFDPNKTLTHTGVIEMYHLKKNADAEEEFSVTEPIVMEKGVKNKWYPKFKVSLSTDDISCVPGLCEKIPGDEGWNVEWTIKVTPDAKKWIEDHLLEIYNDESPKSYRDLRLFVKDNGYIVPTKNLPFRKGDTTKVKYSHHENILFMKKNKDGGFLLGPGVQIASKGCTAECMLYVGKEEFDDPEDKRSEQELRDAKEKRRRIERKVVRRTFTFTSKARDPVICGKQDLTLSDTERMSDRIPITGHPFVPLKSVFDDKTHSLPLHIMLRAKEPRKDGTPAVFTPTLFWGDPETRGYTVIKEHLPLNAFMATTDTGEVIYNVSVCGKFYQWVCEPAPEDGIDPMFFFYARSTGDTIDNLWPQYGVPDKQQYALVAYANQDLELLLDFNTWEKTTREKYEDQKTSPLDNVGANYMGTYIGGFKSFKVNFAASFLSGNCGFEVSLEWVEKDFRAYFGTEQDENENQVKTLSLKSNDENYKNPLPGGLKAIVVPMGMGGGQFKANRPSTEKGIEKNSLVAFRSPNAISLLDGTRRFFVLTNFEPNADTHSPEVIKHWFENKEKYCNRANGLLADDFLNEVTRTYGGEKFRTFVYALDKNAPMGSNYKTFRSCELAEASGGILLDTTTPPVHDDDDDNVNEKKRPEREGEEQEDKGSKRSKQDSPDVMDEEDDE